MNNINTVDILAFNAVTPCEVSQPLKMLAVDGYTETPITFLIVGAHASAVKTHLASKTKRFMSSSAIAEKQGKTEEFTEKLVDAKDKNEIEGAAVRVTGWEGATQEFSQALLKQVLANNPHWIGQIIKFSDNIGNFTK